MNLALAISTISSGGAELVMCQLANHMARQGHCVTLITLDRVENDFYPLDTSIRRVSLDMMAHSQGRAVAAVNNLRRIAALRRAVVDSGASVVLSFEDRINVLSVLATVGLAVRRVICERNNPTEHSIGSKWGMLRRLIYPLADILVVQSDAFVPWAHRVMRSRGVVQVIPNPVRDMTAFKRSGSEKDEHLLVAVGRLAPQKNLDLLITAFARIAAEFPAWRLTIVGEGREEESLAKLAHENGIGHRVTFAGWVPEPGVILARAAVYVMSSRYEGLSNALLEAMACGLPVISTAWAGASEVITHEFDGLLVPVGRAPELAAAMARLMAEPETRESLGKNACAVSERYNPALVMQRWDAVIAARCQQAPAVRSYS